MAQRVLVTAGASGIGREIVRAFAANGASVFVCDIDSRALNMLAGEITSLKIGICDVSKRADTTPSCRARSMGLAFKGCSKGARR